MRTFIGTILTVLVLSGPAAVLHAETGSRERRTAIIVENNGCGRNFRYRHDGCRDDRCRRYMPHDRFGIRFGVGMSSMMSVFDFVGYPSREDGLGLSGYYGDYHSPTKSSGVYSIGAEWLAARWLAVSADIGVEAVWHDRYDGLEDVMTGTSTGVALSALVHAKFIYINKPGVRLYSSLGFGALNYFGFYALETSWRDENGVHFSEGSFRGAFEAVLLGLEVGRSFFGFVESGIGSMFTGVRAGAGYRF